MNGNFDLDVLPQLDALVVVLVSAEARSTHNRIQFTRIADIATLPSSRAGTLCRWGARSVWPRLDPFLV